MQKLYKVEIFLNAYAVVFCYTARFHTGIGIWPF